MPDQQSLRVLLSHIYAWPEHHRGAERYLHELAWHLESAGHKVQLLTTSADGYRDRFIGDIPIDSVKRRPKKRHGSQAEDIAFSKAALRYAVRRRWDVWHATSVGDATAAVQLSTMRPMRTVFTDHGFPTRASRAKRSDTAYFDKVVTQIQDYVCVSQPAADALWQDYKRSATVIAPGVDTDQLILGSTRADRPTVLYSGSLTESRKNVALLLEAFDNVLSARADAQLWLCGGGDPSTLLSAATERVRSAVTVTGVLNGPELVERYQQAWVTALPSDAEVFGMALTESLSCGTPGIGLDDGLGPSTILTARTGVLAERSAAGIATALEQALTLATKPSTRKACRERALTFDWKRSVVPALEALYRAEKKHDDHHH